jgi:hypothetical protein
MKTTAFLLTMLVPAVVSAREKPTTGYAPVNGLKTYDEVHGSGEPVVRPHGAFMGERKGDGVNNRAERSIAPVRAATVPESWPPGYEKG